MYTHTRRDTIIDALDRIYSDIDQNEFVGAMSLISQLRTALTLQDDQGKFSITDLDAPTPGVHKN